MRKSAIDEVINYVDLLEDELRRDIDSSEKQINETLKYYTENESFEFPNDCFEIIGKIAAFAEDAQDDMNRLYDDLEKQEDECKKAEEEYQEQLSDFEALKIILKNLSTNGKKSLVRLLISEEVFDAYHEEWFGKFIDVSKAEILNLIEKTKAMK